MEKDNDFRWVGGVKKKKKAEVSGDKRAGDPEVKLPTVHSHWTGVVAE